MTDFLINSSYTNLSFRIQDQFPAIYKENAKNLIDLVSTYYKFVENETTESGYNTRRLDQYYDIDTTLNNMLVFFRNKFLNSLPFTNDNTRFIVKHILDLYKRKGSRESIELFFKIFFNETITIYYPSNDILKASGSKWKSDRYIELYPIEDSSLLSTLSGSEITGSISGATAAVDAIKILDIDNTYFPVIFLSNIWGEFEAGDRIFTSGTLIGKVRGSLIKVTSIDTYKGTANNKVGDNVKIWSNTGIGAQGLVTSVSVNPTGSLDYVINDGGYGYTLENTTIYTAEQMITLDSYKKYELLEIIHNDNGAEAMVIGQTSSVLGLVFTANSTNTFVTNDNIYTVNRDTNISSTILYATSYNNSANAEIGTLSDTEIAWIIPDLIKNFLNVRLNSTNYSDVPPALTQMSGNAPSGLPPIVSTTKLSDAFKRIPYTIGSIASLTNINPGDNYTMDQMVLAFDSLFYSLKKYDQYVYINNTQNISLSVGSTVMQSNGATGLIKSIVGNVIFIKLRSYTRFSSMLPLLYTDYEIPVIYIGTDYNDEMMGINADILGVANYTTGKILSVTVTNSGYGFLNDSKIYMKNITRNTGNVSAVGIANATGMGKSLGYWETTTGHLNSEKKIQDSYYYQDYSYEINTKLLESEFMGQYKPNIHPAGMKVFVKFNTEDIINININNNSEMEIIK